MADDGAGTYKRTNGANTGPTTWTQDRDGAIKITALRHDAHDQDIATALTNRVCKDGQSTMTGDLKMGGFNVTGAGNFNGVAPPIEHSFTPELVDNSGFGTFTATTEYGYALEMGDLVSFIIKLDGSWNGAQVAVLQVTGLPLTIDTASDGAPVNIHHTDMSAEPILEAAVHASSNSIRLYEPAANGSRSLLQGGDTVNDTTAVTISGFYIKA